jgi:hypothetical protein
MVRSNVRSCLSSGLGRCRYSMGRFKLSTTDSKTGLNSNGRRPTSLRRVSYQSTRSRVAAALIGVRITERTGDDRNRASISSNTSRSLRIFSGPLGARCRTSVILASRRGHHISNTDCRTSTLRPLAPNTPEQRSNLAADSNPGEPPYVREPSGLARQSLSPL